MVSSQLTVRQELGAERSILPAVAIATWAAAVLALVLLAIAIGTVPGGRSLARALLGANATTAPHATTNRSVGYALGLLVNNAIVALWPLTGLYLFRNRPRSGHRVFTVIVVLSDVRSVGPLAAGIGLWGQRLLPYIPNAPFELAAITTGGVLYVLGSRRRISARSLRNGVAAVLLLLTIAAALETWAVPNH